MSSNDGSVYFDDLNLINLSSLTKDQKEKRFNFNQTKGVIHNKLIHDLFYEASSLFPSNVAIVDSGKAFTYKVIAELSNQLGHFLQNQNVKPNQLVAIAVEKGWRQVVACLGVLSSGAAYLPIDPEFPLEKIEELIRLGEVSLVVTNEKFVSKFQGISPFEHKSKNIISIDSKSPIFSRCSKKRPTAVQNHSDLAYVIFTSGSTGKPKGVMIEHRAALNTIVDINERFSITSKDKILALSNLNFDLSVYDIFGLLGVGGTIVFPDPDQLKNPFHWLSLIEKEKVTLWNSVPMFMQMFVEILYEKVSSCLRLVLLSGDWIPLDLAEKIRRFFGGNIRLIGLGGATEASIWSIFHEILPSNTYTKSIPYGCPLRNQRFYVLNEEDKICADDIVGQLYIGGVGLAKGYWKDAERTEMQFINHPHLGIIYKTGDLGKYLPSNQIEFIGRDDFQVKINGFRVELQEIEFHISKYQGVDGAIVIAEDSSSQNKKLIAFLIAKDSLQINADHLGAHLMNVLPKYMIPSSFVFVNEFPLSSNGKIDRNALKEKNLVEN